MELPVKKVYGYYSVREASLFLGFSRSYIYYMINTGKIKAEKLGSQFVIPEQEIERFQENWNQEARDKLNKLVEQK